MAKLIAHAGYGFRAFGEIGRGGHLFWCGVMILLVVLLVVVSQRNERRG